MDNFIKVSINKEFKNRIQYGYLWIFSNEIAINTKPKEIVPVDVYDYNDNFLCKGVYNPYSLIAIRILSFDKKEKVDKKFFKQKILKALQYREKHGINITYCRLVYGESDLLPGVVIDRYNDIFVLQFYSYGMEVLYKELILECIIDLFNPKYIVIKNDFYQRELECAPKYKKIVYSKNDEQILLVEIHHLGIRFFVDVLNGQKTGFYYDQLDNRRYVANIVKNKRVLDLCCYTGSFSIISALNQCKYVIGVDSSENAIKIAKENAKINNVNIEFVCSKIENFVKSNTDKYDVIIFDPPSYVKSYKDIDEGIKKYQYMCKNILNMLDKNGIFCFSVCSRHISLLTTEKIIITSMLKNKQKGFILYYGKQSNDHPIYLPMKEETEYLKFITVELNTYS